MAASVRVFRQSRSRHPWRGPVAITLSVGILCGTYAFSEDTTGSGGSVPERPVPLFNRWQEDWSVLADPRVPREPFDFLKYIPLSASDPASYLSLGANVRERFEANDAVSFGVGKNHNADYDISRVEVHADLHWGEVFQFFTQLQNDNAFGKQTLTPVDQDRKDLEQAFVALIEPIGEGTFKLRVGRQQFALDLQRFVSVRDGPNVRQSYDAIWFDYEIGRWRVISFYSQPVQDRDLRPFDDYSNSHLTYGGFRVERKLSADVNLAAYYSRFKQDGAKFPSISGNERRNIGDIHLDGKPGAVDWDVEFMNQTGELGVDSIEAWAFGSLAGYTFAAAPASPRIGIQFDAASGDRHPNDHQLNTFNPLFPNGYYVTLAGYTGYTNFIHLKPSLTLRPVRNLKVTTALGFQWRESTHDAVYTQPDVPVAGTSNHPGRYTGTYGQFRTEYAATSHIALALEVVHFAIADALRSVGAHDSDYVGAEIKYEW
jgi:hypothetical protein